MNKADRNRVEELRVLVEQGKKETSFEGIRVITHLRDILSIIDKQNKVVEAAKQHKARSIATEEALGELEHEEPALEFPPPF